MGTYEIQAYQVKVYGQITQKYSLKIQGKEIPSIIGNPIKCLGKWYDDSLKDVNNNKHLDQQATERLANIDKSGLPGKFKLKPGSSRMDSYPG